LASGKVSKNCSGCSKSCLHIKKLPCSLQKAFDVMLEQAQAKVQDITLIDRNLGNSTPICIADIFIDSIDSNQQTENSYFLAAGQFRGFTEPP
jgi:hypothetical protein